LAVKAEGRQGKSAAKGVAESQRYGRFMRTLAPPTSLPVVRLFLVCAGMVVCACRRSLLQSVQLAYQRRWLSTCTRLAAVYLQQASEGCLVLGWWEEGEEVGFALFTTIRLLSV